MATRQNFNTSMVARMTEAFPQAVVIVGQYIFLSGMPGTDPETGKVNNINFEDQVRQCFLNIKTVLEEAGSDI